MHMSDLLRSATLARAYKAHRESGAMEHACALCEKEAIETFTHWRVVPNSFPYDMIAQTHHMLVPVRHVKEFELTDDEREELLQLKRGYVQKYHFILEATEQSKSIPQHFHLHLIIGKKIEGEPHVAYPEATHA
jgi:diadenosine tetraphosphate (Ap4A) HIT family hydrolase